MLRTYSPFLTVKYDDFEKSCTPRTFSHRYWSLKPSYDGDNVVQKSLRGDTSHSQKYIFSGTVGNPHASIMLGRELRVIVNSPPRQSILHFSQREPADERPFSLLRWFNRKLSQYQLDETRETNCGHSTRCSNSTQHLLPSILLKLNFLCAR